MDRLLSDKQICEVCPANLMLTSEHIKLRCSVGTCIVHPDNKALAKAQLAKADKEWVEWVITNAEVEGDTIILPGKLWRERRKEIGL
jgi:hypothetical protein